MFNRHRQIARVLAKYGFAEFLQQDSRFSRLIPTSYLQKERNVSTKERLRLALEELGPTFVKLGQFLSTRDDLLAKDYTEELEKLTDNVAPMNYEMIRLVVKEELGKYPEEYFKTFSKKPIGSASIGQVHCATLKNGIKVAVKIQRRDISKIIADDLAIMTEFASAAETYSIEAREVNARKLVEYFRDSITRELDYDRELRNTQKFHDFFSSDKRIIVPKVYPEYSTPRLLVMERVEGLRIPQWLALKPTGKERKRLAMLGTEIFLRQLLELGHFQQDPHSGNFLITKHGQAVLLDFGMTGFIDEDAQEKIIEMFINLVEKDSEGVVNALSDLGMTGDADEEKLRMQIAELIDEYYDVSLKQIDVQHFFQDLLRLMRDNKIELPNYFIALSRMLITIEGIARQIYPQYNFVEAGKPFFKKLAKEQPKKILKRTMHFAQGTGRLLAGLPKRISSLLDKAEHGRVEVRLMHENISPLSNSLEDISNKVSLSVLTAALIVASAMLVTNKIGPLYDGYSIIGLLGYLFSGIIGAYLILSILRTTRFK